MFIILFESEAFYLSITLQVLNEVGVPRFVTSNDGNFSFVKTRKRKNIPLVIQQLREIRLILLVLRKSRHRQEKE